MARITLSLPAAPEGSRDTFSHIKMRLDNKGKGQFRAEGSTIWLYDAIAGSDEEAQYFGGVSPSAFIGQLAAMSGDVTLRVNSPGGSVFGAQAMVAAIRQHQGKVTAQVDSLAASAASVIAVACAECVMVPGAMMMIHKAWGMVIGNENDMRQTADLLGKLDGTLADAYAAKSGGTAADALAMMAAETWLTAQEAVDAGFADSIMEADTQKQPKAQWNLSAFKAAPVAVVAPMAAAPAAYNDADTAFARGMITINEAIVATAKATVSTGVDREILGFAGDTISDSLEAIEGLQEWLGARGLGPVVAADDEEIEDSAEADRQARMRRTDARLRAYPI